MFFLSIGGMDQSLNIASERSLVFVLLDEALCLDEAYLIKFLLAPVLHERGRRASPLAMLLV